MNECAFDSAFNSTFIEEGGKYCLFAVFHLRQCRPIKTKEDGLSLLLPSQLDSSSTR